MLESRQPTARLPKMMPAMSKPTAARQQRQAEQRQHERHERLEAALDARVAQQMASFRRQVRAKHAKRG
jgi:hypothetical protein